MLRIKSRCVLKYSKRVEAKMGTEISDTDLLGVVKTTTNPLHELQKAIVAMPAVDSEKVKSAINKLKAQGLDISGTEEERLACANRIAKQIIDECSGTDL